MVTFADHFYCKYYCGHRAMLSIGNVLPLLGIPEGAVVCNVEHHIGDRGVFTKASGDYAIMISHNPNNDTSRQGSSWTGTLSTKVWPPWLMDVSDISSTFMNWPI